MNSENKKKLKILFLCTGNACRSQMAEGWSKHLKKDSIVAFSAGIRPIGVSENVIRVMSEVGIDISNHTSKHLDDLRGINFDYVITLCDNAKANCPVFTGEAKLVHKPFQDPYGAFGTQEQVLGMFRDTRDKIKEFVDKLPENLNSDGTK